jgi:hypothetical protein
MKNRKFISVDFGPEHMEIAGQYGLLTCSIILDGQLKSTYVCLASETLQGVVHIQKYENTVVVCYFQISHGIISLEFPQLHAILFGFFLFPYEICMGKRIYSTKDDLFFQPSRPVPTS